MGNSRSGGASRIVVAWHGLPHYAARLIRAGIEAFGSEVAVIGTPPGVPIRGMEEALGQPVVWIEAAKKTSWESLGLEVPMVMFQTGWAVSAFNSLSGEVKRRNGKVVAFVDNIPRRDLRQLVGATVFRLALKDRFDAVMVPGASGRLLAAKFGIPPERVFGEMYGADPAIFTPPPAGTRRAKEFLFVGQFIERKGIDLLVEAFRDVRRRHPDFRLRLVGGGPLRQSLSGDGVAVEEFLQPLDLAKRYQEAAFFVLPSREEHWGLVVHEAALSGNILLVSDEVGAGTDLVDPANGLVFRSRSVPALVEAMERAISLDDESYERMSRHSITKAAGFGPAAWVGSFLRILDYLGIRRQAARHT